MQKPKPKKAPPKPAQKVESKPEERGRSRENGVNRVILIGRLGKDPEVRFTQTGTAVCNMTMATSETWKDKNGEKQEKTEWHKIVVWGKSGEACGQYLTKGARAYVEGKLQTRKYEKDGVDHYSTEVVAQQVQFLGGKSAPKQETEGEDEIPF